jgi:hypothetical protein
MHHADLASGELLGLAHRATLSERKAVQDAAHDDGPVRDPVAGGGQPGQFAQPALHVAGRQEHRVVEVDDVGERRCRGGRGEQRRQVR